MDYKDIFDSVFDGLNNAGLKSVLRNERVPFEYCEKAMKTRKLDWNCKLAIALRTDCSDETLVKLCRNMCYKFTEGLLDKYKRRIGRDIPDEAISELLRKKENLQPIVQYWHLSDNMKRRILKRFVVRDGKNEYCMSQHFVNFIKSQLTIPEDCFETIDVIMKKYVKNQTITSYCLLNDFVLKLLRTPFDESIVEEFFNSHNRPLTTYFQIAANPSISDYVIMRLLTQTPENFLGEVKEILDKNEKKREEYRRTHGNV